MKTKQEEIRDGIYNEIKMTMHGQGWAYWGVLRDTLLNYLYDNDVVIKVERELPRILVDADKAQTVRDTKRMMLKAGYVAVESLIKEDK